MSLEETARTELLRLRKRQGGTTVAAMAQTEALRQVLGGGDPRLAYNALKHILINQEQSLAVVAVSYSLGFASEGATHLDRLSDFGTEYSYDQRQARRYSDAGLTELARQIASEWTLEAAPVLEARVLRADDTTLELYLRTERLTFIEMQEPVVEAVNPDGTRITLPCDWHPGDQGHAITASTNVVVLTEAAASIRWPGELWPRFVAMSEPSHGTVRVETLASRMQVVVR
jgi:hypothetical protein